MEGDHSSPEEPEQAASEGRGGSSSSIRTYDCTFCKRGFSNAQALGGHMNIHKRERAKIKQQSNLCRLPVDISSEIVSSYSPPPTSFISQLAHGGDDIGGLFKWPRILPTQRDIHRDETHEARRQPLPLFLEAPLQGEDGPPRSVVERQEEKGSGSGAAAVELDLELRLGPDPPHETVGCKECV